MASPPGVPHRQHFLEQIAGSAAAEQGYRPFDLAQNAIDA
jgi:hypothetical protein